MYIHVTVHNTLTIEKGSTNTTLQVAGTYFMQLETNHKKDSVMPIPTPEKADKKGMPLTSLSLIPMKIVEFRDGMGLRLVNGIPCLSALSGVGMGITKSLLIFVSSL